MVAKAKMDRGELVDDDTMIAIVRERLSRPDVNRGFILDGFPRTVDQARALDRLMDELGKGQLLVVDLVVAEEDLVRRLAGRRICSSCGENAAADDGPKCRRCGGELTQRPDDREEVVRERLNVYARSTKPLVDFYRTRPTFRAVNGAQAPDLVARELDLTIDDAASMSSRAGMGA
jgi:adenylate kinase